MACRVGITTDPEERKRYWQSRYRSLRNLRIVGQYNSKTKAQQEETRLARLVGLRSFSWRSRTRICRLVCICI